jgi:hypothetical protein
MLHLGTVSLPSDVLETGRALLQIAIFQSHPQLLCLQLLTVGKI